MVFMTFNQRMAIYLFALVIDASSCGGSSLLFSSHKTHPQCVLGLGIVFKDAFAVIGCFYSGMMPP